MLVSFRLSAAEIQLTSIGPVQCYAARLALATDRQSDRLSHQRFPGLTPPYNRVSRVGSVQSIVPLAPCHPSRRRNPRALRTLRSCRAGDLALAVSVGTPVTGCRTRRPWPISWTRHSPSGLPIRRRSGPRLTRPPGLSRRSSRLFTRSRTLRLGCRPWFEVPEPSGTG